MQKDYTKTSLTDIVKECKSIRQVIIKLGLPVTGGRYITIKKYIDLWNIDTSHFTGQVWNKGIKTGPHPGRKPFKDILVKNSTYTTNHLRERLIGEGILEHKCSQCLGTTWNGKPIPVQLDHINGINNDHRLENLRILCPNCHAQTDTYCGKNKKKK